MHERGSGKGAITRSAIIRTDWPVGTYWHSLPVAVIILPRHGRLTVLRGTMAVYSTRKAKTGRVQASDRQGQRAQLARPAWWTTAFFRPAPGAHYEYEDGRAASLCPLNPVLAMSITTSGHVGSRPPRGHETCKPTNSPRLSRAAGTRGEEMESKCPGRQHRKQSPKSICPEADTQTHDQATDDDHGETAWKTKPARHGTGFQ